MVLAFFFAGAIVFPLLNNFYLGRVLLTGGIAAVMYGVESVVRLGHIETCGLLIGNCSAHSVRLAGCLVWAALFAWLSVRRRLGGDDDAAVSSGTTTAVSTLQLALALVALLVVVAWLAGSTAGGFRRIAASAAESAPIVKVARTHPADATVAHGLTFGLLQTAAPATGAMVTLGCHGQPAPADQPHHDSCNPYEGDTSCRAILPIACTNAASTPQIGATQPVAGSALTSLEAATGRCAADLGPGWRMAGLHDGSGWQFSGQHARGLLPATRYWVHIDDQPGNCWDPRRP